MLQSIQDKRRKAFLLGKKNKEQRGSIQQVAYKQTQMEEQKRQEETPEYEKEYHIDKRNKMIVDIKEKLAEYLTENHSYELKGSMFDFKIRQKLLPIILGYIRNNKVVIVGFDEEGLTSYMLDEIAGLGPIDEIIRREGSLNEVWINGENPITKEIDIWYEKNGQKFFEEEVKFRDKKHAYEIAQKIARNGQQKFGTELPVANVRYPDGRVNLIQEPIATGGGGPYVSFRLFPKDTFKPADFLKSGSMNEEMMDFTMLAMKYGLNGLMVGATGSGKTTLLSACVDFIPNTERILLMEDTEEMRLRHKYPEKHIITEECKFNSIDEQRNFDLAFLTKTALRQKPDYMIYGEVRDKAAYDMLNGANTGHKVWSTLHARSAEKAVQRLVNMVLEHGSKMGTDAIGKMIVQAVDIIYFQKKYPDNVRRVKEIIELIDFENGKPIYNTLFKFVVEGKNPDGTIHGRHYRVGKLSQDRAEFLVDEFADLNLIRRFTQNPEEAPKINFGLDNYSKKQT
ncbi:ATPase, T2SS/T4P/T4SS family [Brevibacillus halotolerans]|uniref:CpaF family protein n=1 Tax=Brevibacillus TaxID=55080 RepID=UPI00215D472F|nr:MULTISPECIES: ATPase, T2SS/T4P/T4SS family [Brevibacillus]MCR8964098.1 ATPase, T2SS/T4P/T4SS family [Brevibacillus laterosporus]MCZ0836253.1 ATPase, T2SS/T4P/T4SS family [Brevibacillus halotolerans]